MHDWVGIVAERYLDGSFEAMNVSVVAGALISFMLPHQRNQFLGGPALGLKVVVVRGRCPSVHLEIMSESCHISLGVDY